MKAAKVESWSSLQQMTELDLDWKNLSGLPECFGQLTQLKELYLFGNPLGQFPEYILRLHNLTLLSLAETGLKQLPDNFGDKLPNLEWLYIDRNRLRRLPSSFAKLQKLEQLALTVEPDSEFGLSQIPLSPKLNTLYIRTYLIIQTSKKKQASRKGRTSSPSARQSPASDGGITIQIVNKNGDLSMFSYVIHIPIIDVNFIIKLKLFILFYQS